MVRMGAQGRAERCRHQRPPQDGQMGRAWQAPGANLGQIQGQTSTTPLLVVNHHQLRRLSWTFHEHDGLKKLSHSDTKCLSLPTCKAMVYKHLMGSSLSTLELLFATFSARGGHCGGKVNILQRPCTSSCTVHRFWTRVCLGLHQAKLIMSSVRGALRQGCHPSSSHIRVAASCFAEAHNNYFGRRDPGAPTRQRTP